MKKKLLLICVGIFALLFLLWPTSTQSFPCGPTGDCPSQLQTGVGGGARMISSLLSGTRAPKGFSQYWVSRYTYFEPNIALLGSLAIAGFVFMTGSAFIKNSKPSRKR
jgi:hypothetical protein